LHHVVCRIFFEAIGAVALAVYMAFVFRQCIKAYELEASWLAQHDGSCVIGESVLAQYGASFDTPLPSPQHGG
jgi:hypothetical protein